LALSVISPTEFWAVEGSLVPPGSQYTSGANVATYLLHNTNGQWSYSQAPPGFSPSSFAAISTNDVWIGGSLGTASKGTYVAVIAHYVRGHWILYK
jgi:hypothetical protein